MKPLRDQTESQLARTMTAAANAVGAAVPPGSLFAVLVFDFDAGADVQYISNANRADMIRAMRACADRLERRETAERVGFDPFN